MERVRGSDHVDRLIAELRACGVGFLSGACDPETEADVARDPLPAVDLLRELAASAEPRLRDATIALLLLHPELATTVPDSATAPADAQDSASAGAVREQLAVLMLATTYLQRMWHTRLALAIGARPWLPVDLWRERELPAPELFEGEWGLRVLAERERCRRGVSYNFLSAWQDQVDHLAAQGWLARHRPDGGGGLAAGGRARSAAGALPAFQHARGIPHAPRGGGAMSLRPPVDRTAIESFLRRLGAEVHQPGRVYLVGGTTMVYEGFRARTLDIDVLVEADDPGPLVAAIRQLKDALSINVEFASPGDFIPLPAGWRERSIWIGRFGMVDVFHFDLYSMALSKIERGTERDFEDVLALVRSGRVDREQLDAAYAEVLPRIATEGLGSMDPTVFAAHYEAVRERLAQ